MPAGRTPMLEDPAYDEKVQAFLDGIVEGLSITGAAGAAGISLRAIMQWQERGDEDDAPECYAHFLQRFAQAKAAREHRRISIIEAAAPEDWRAAAWLAERQQPADYGPSQKVEATVTTHRKLLEIDSPLPEAEDS